MSGIRKYNRMNKALNALFIGIGVSFWGAFALIGIVALVKGF